MKKNFTPKLVGLALTAALTLTALTACGNKTGTTAVPDSAGSTPDVIQAAANDSVGTVLLSVNPEIEIDYDELGNVVALNALNDDGRAVLAAYSGYEGKACTAVVSELVDEINAGGYFDATIDGNEKTSCSSWSAAPSIPATSSSTSWPRPFGLLLKPIKSALKLWL